MKKSSLSRTGLLLVFAIGVAYILGGCAVWGHYGTPDVTWRQIKAPSALLDKSEAEVIETLGSPDFSFACEGSEYMVYYNTRGFFIVVYGKVEEKDLVLKLKGGKVVSSALVDKGMNKGLFLFPPIQRLPGSSRPGLKSVAGK